MGKRNYKYYMKKALITGSRGFVGPYLKAELKQNGYVVYETDCARIEEDNYYYADITDKNKIKNVIEKVQPEYVYHLAGISSPALAEEKPELTHNVNVKGTENVFDAVKGDKKIKILAVGSSFVYGRPESLPIKEDHPLNGKGVYARSRMEQEKLVQNFKGKINYVIVRSFNHTGPGQSDIFVIPKIVKQIVEIKKSRRTFLELGNIEVKRDILDVRDVVRAYRLLLEQNKFGVICNVCRGESIGIKEVIDYINSFVGLEKVKVVGDSGMATDDVLDIWGDNGYLKTLIDWKPEIDYKNMLKDIYKYWDRKII